MNQHTDCDRARLQLMAALDGEAASAAEPTAEHLSTCSSCRQWLAELESMSGRLHTLSYPAASLDLWADVQRRIGQPDRTAVSPHRLLAIGILVLAWRALQLLFDLPFPLLHPLVPMAGAVAALWHVAGDPLAIATFAPELQKRGV